MSLITPLNKIQEKSVFFSLIMYQFYLRTEAIPIIKQIFLDLTNETKKRNEDFFVIRIPTYDNINYSFYIL